MCRVQHHIRNRSPVVPKHVAESATGSVSASARTTYHGYPYSPEGCEGKPCTIPVFERPYSPEGCEGKPCTIPVFERPYSPEGCESKPCTIPVFERPY